MSTGSAKRGGWAKLVSLALVSVMSACSAKSSNGSPVEVPDGATRRVPVAGQDISEETAQLLAQVALLWDGKDANFDGDLFSELKVLAHDPNGETQVAFFRYAGLDTVPRATWTLNRKTGNNLMLFDYNLDGVVEAQITETKTGREILEDHSGSGAFDWRRVEVFGAEGQMTVTLSHKAGDEFVVDDNYVVSRRRPKCGKANPQGAATDGSVAEPDCFEPMPAPSSSGGVSVADSGAPMDIGGWCSSEHSQRLLQAFDCAAKRAMSCLNQWNKDEQARFDNALHKQSLPMDCALKSSCNAIAAGDSTGVSFSPTAIDAKSDEELCTITFHEMMHWAGTPDDDQLHGDGVDRVYACGRFCDPTCSYIASGAGQNIDPDCGTNPASDCAACAASDMKGMCGFKKMYLAADAAVQSCRSDTNRYDYVDCPVPVASYWVYCDGAIESRITINPCCVECPGGTVNEFSCDQWMGGARPGDVIDDSCSTRTTCHDSP